MALKKTIITASGLTADNAYIRVENPKLVGKSAVEFEAACYVSDNHPVSFYMTRHTGPYDMNGSNPFKQAYLHLKTLPQFADAVDC
jgi:hypothetical protein